MSIRNKLFIILLLLSIIPVAIVGLIAIKDGQASLEKQIGATSLEFARLSLQRISEYLHSKYVDVQRWARDHMEDISTDDRDGRIREFLVTLLQHRDEFYYVACMNIRGQIVASSHDALIGVAHSSAPGFKEALNGVPNIQDVAFNERFGGYALVISVPITDRTDQSKVLGVLSAVLKWQKVNEMIIHLKIGGEKQNLANHIMLTDHTGLATSCFDPREMFTANLTEFGMKSSQYAQEHKEGYLVEISEHNLPAFATYTYLKRYKDLPYLDWHLILLQDSEIIFASVKLLKKTIILTLFSVILVLSIISVLFANRISQPVLAVAAMARAIGKGDYKRRVSVNSKDEVGLLSASFNTMVEDLQEAKDAILLEKQRLDDVTRFANCGLLLLNDQVRITYANQVAQEWFGPFEQIKGKFCREILEPRGPVKESACCAGLEALRTGQTAHSDIFPKAVKGEDKFFYAIASPVKDNDGNTFQIIEVIIDMTEHKEAEEELKKFKTISDKASYGTGIADLDGNIVYVNNAFAEMHGYKPEELIGKHLSVFHSEEQMERVNTLDNVLKREGSFAAEEVWHVKRDGSIFPTLMNASIITDDNGEPLLMSATAIDITELKRIEDQLRTLSRAIDQSPTSVIITDPDGNIEYVNPKFTQITGYTSEEVLGKNPRILKSEETPPEEYKRLWDTITSGEQWLGEFHNKKKSGELFWESASISPIRNSEGEITHFVAVKEDITEHKRLAEQRAELEEQLRHAQKMETIGTLAGGIAHDFNNILQAIHGYVEMCLTDVSATSQVHADLEQVLEATNRAKNLVQQILTFSRHAEQERRPLRLQTIVKEVLKLLKASLPSTIEIRQNIDTKCAAVLADPTRVHQVLMNLCTNAYQAMRVDGGVLEVSLSMVDVDAKFLRAHPNLLEGRYVRLTVSDTGHGMDRTTMARIFEPFFTTKEVGEGTGLGLSVVHGIVASHDGEITVESQPGKGTTFHVYLPQAESDVEQGTREDETFLKGNERILFVDDEEVVGAVMKRLLERLGYDVTLRNSSVDALETFRAQPDKFDLVITDQSMPKMTGVKLAAELLHLRSNVPIILMTGFSETVAPETAKKMGICEFIMKPVVASDLSKAIRRVLDQKQVKEA